MGLNLDPEILREYRKFCTVRNLALKSGVVDLSNYSWVYPTFLVPLCNLFLNYELEYKKPRNHNVDNYIDTVVSTEYSNGSTYLPLQDLPKNHTKLGEVISNLQEWCDNGENYGGANAFNFILNELIDNIYEHSYFNHAFVLAQSYPTKGFSEISIFDDGISIPGSFNKHGIPFRSDADAISMAINGTSTKSKRRGYGINSSMRMYIEGGRAEVLWVSRNGIFYKKKSEPAKLYNAEYMNTSNSISDNEHSHTLEGTLFSVRLPYPASKIEAHLYY